jgi:hypothetical protein
MKNTENLTNRQRIEALEIGESLWTATTRDGVGTPVTKVDLRGGGVGITYRVSASHRQGTDCARLDERADGWLNTWTLYATKDEATAAAKARRAEMSGIALDCLTHGCD